jgi:Sodium/glutamate symporter
MNIGIYGALVAASLVLLLGNRMVAWIPVAHTYTIPEPVAGGLVVAIVLLLMRVVGHTEVHFDFGVASVHDARLLRDHRAECQSREPQTRRAAAAFSRRRDRLAGTKALVATRNRPQWHTTRLT